MNSKMYVVLIVIWLMYLPKGKIILFKEISSYFCSITKGRQNIENLFEKCSQNKLIVTLLRKTKMNKLLKQNTNIL